MFSLSTIGSCATLIAVLAFGEAANAQTVAKTAAPPLKKVTVGSVSSLNYMPLYVALEQGMFRQQGLDVDAIVTPTASSALVSGNIEFALVGSDFAVLSAARGRPTPAIVMLTQRNSNSISASTAIPLPNLAKGYPENLRDLKGRSIAVPNRGTGAEALVKQSFQAIGFEDGRDYSMVVIGQAATIVNALKSKQVDAALLWPPFAEQAWLDKTATALVLPNDPKAGPKRAWQGAGTPVLVNPTFLKNNREVVKKFIAAVVEGAAFNRDPANMERLIDIAAKYSGVSDRKVLAIAVQSEAALAYPGIDCESWAETASALVESGTIKAAPKCEEIAALDVAPRSPISAER